MRVLLAAVLVCMSSFGVWAQEVDRKDPYQMIVIVADQSFERLRQDQAQIENDPNHLKVIVEEELLPYVNYRYSALKLLGSEVKKNSREDVLAFIEAFKDYMVASYAQVLTQYSQQKVQFGAPPTLTDSERITGVKVTILDAPNPNIQLEFKLRKEKNGDWAAFDIIAEGVSLLSSKQSEWLGEVRRQGLPAVTEELARQAKLPIKKVEK
ncbi:ABC transporter substrate-binding protein [Vibrio agarivorans]|uniref:ABC transporter substrate-binding protein n=1 Tax=Vibrio agarivorans TaxID=153622 RepID=UPI0025B2B5B5|nr:ABC transporter substrate-binding protein [Vibrio agarivorans]MDN3661688.1 ABC transporter substrate-binding protein [Vibrio agarivorans]